MVDIENVKNIIHELYNSLEGRQNKSNELLDITDVLFQVYLKIDSANNPEALVNRLVHYIRSVSLKGRIYYPPKDENLMIKLGIIGQKAGINGLYKADFSDKSQFFSYFDNNKMIRR